MTLESLIIWVVVGAITGIVLDRSMGGMRIGLGGAILLGIVGAIISGWGFDLLGYRILSGLIGSILEALLGAVVLTLIFGVFLRF